MDWRGPFTGRLMARYFSRKADDGWRNYALCFDQQKSALVIMTNRENGEGISKDVLETLLLLKDTFTPIEWEGYVPFDKLPPRPPLKPRQQIAVEGKILDRYVGRLPDTAEHHLEGPTRGRSSVSGSSVSAGE